MPEKPATPDINSWLQEELYQEYLSRSGSVDESWKDVFRNAAPAASAAAPATTNTAKTEIAPPPGDAQQLVPLRGAAARIAENMTRSLAIPVATSQRTIPVKVMEENRRIINQQRAILGKSKISFTHLIGFAVLRGLEKHPGLNDAYAENEGEAFRHVRREVNLGIAVDVAGAGGQRNLLVPNIKNAAAMNFAQYAAAFEEIVNKARRARLTVDDFQGTTISLTNPGTVGTLASVPRLMPSQGAIIAAGAIDYPAEYQGVSAEARAALGLSKVMTMTCTYDHRIIQGAESGMFLGVVQSLLQGDDGFYDWIFADLKMPHHPVRWESDRPATHTGVASGHHAEIAKEAAVLQLINAYRVRGHLIADLDPLGSDPSYHRELDPAIYGLTIWDLDREFLTGTLGQATGDAAPKPVATLREILETLQRTYCGKIGCEYMNIQHPEQKQWLQQRMEPQANQWPLDNDVRVRILERLTAAEEFEHFLHARFVGQKRFALEGAETAIPILDELLDRAADGHAHEIVIGMAHRGRLNVLANVVGKPLDQIFSEFQGEMDPSSTQGSGDVKYHLGATGIHKSESGREIVVSVSPNPSHLEAVNPVVEGIVRPKQDRLGDATRERVIPLLIHGDAAFAGQGVVAETLNLSQLDGYHTGGTIHLIINNQIGFTTRPEEARSTVYSTDVARMVQAPIFHVNGDDPEAAIRVAQIAFDYRQEFKKDVVIDMICYRRHGHNEADDPSYTEPLLYRKIREQPSVAKLHAERLVREGVLVEEDVALLRKRITAKLQEGHEQAQSNAVRYEVQELVVVDTESMPAVCPRTAVDREALERVIDGLTTFPADFHLHQKLAGFIEKRRAAIDAGPVDWALAEALAFGTLVVEGTPVRLSGQDSARGTFSQRHLRLVDCENGVPHTPHQHLAADQARFEVWDSSLSEYAVVGFEFGYSVGDPLTLVLWEAQFGDFVNGAQIMIDQFIVAAESKWGQPSGLVMLLPHGYEGQGPEHSSARIERFLSQCAENNLQVANCTTPAQYFHLLRRQQCGGVDRRGMRRPLVIFTPKSLLRHARAVSTLDDLATGGFREIIPDATVEADRVSRVLLCSGKIFYELEGARQERSATHIAIIRLEQLYPFPEQDFHDILHRYPVTAEVAWVQEEPHNMGAWLFARDRVQPMLDRSRRTLRYVGRPDSASTATGSYKRHQEEQADIVARALGDEITSGRRVRVVSRRKR